VASDFLKCLPAEPPTRQMRYSTRLSEHLRSGQLYDIGTSSSSINSRRSSRHFLVHVSNIPDPQLRVFAIKTHADAGRWLLRHRHRGDPQAASAVDRTHTSFRGMPSSNIRARHRPLVITEDKWRLEKASPSLHRRAGVPAFAKSFRRDYLRSRHANRNSVERVYVPGQAVFSHSRRTCPSAFLLTSASFFRNAVVSFSSANHF